MAFHDNSEPILCAQVGCCWKNAAPSAEYYFQLESCFKELLDYIFELCEIGCLIKKYSAHIKNPLSF